MINTKTYEEIKNGLVNRVLNDYLYYKEGVNKLHNEIAQGNPSPNFPKISAKRAALYASRKVGKHEAFMIEMQSLSERFEYIHDYKKTFNKAVNHRKNLIENIKDLVSFNKLTKEKFSDKNDATAIFDPIKTYAINKQLSLHFQNIEMIKHGIDKYLENKNEIYLKGIAFKEDDHYKIDNDGLKKKENVFFEEVLKAIEHDLEQIQKIENKKESENYLKYWLLFK